MSTIIGNAVTIGGGGTKLNIDYGATPPTDTTKLWVPLATKPSNVECKPEINFGSEKYVGVVGRLIPYTDYTPSCCYHDGKLYVIVRGAATVNTFLNVVDVNTMSVVASYTPAQFLNNQYSSSSGIYPQIISYNGYIYVIAGYHLYKKDVVNDTTTLVSGAINNNGSARCIAAIDDKIYLLGGWLVGYNDLFSTITEIDLKIGTATNWSTSLPRSIASAGSISFGKYIYFLGGCYSIVNDLFANTIYKIDTANKTVTTLSAKLPTDNCHFAYAQAGSKLYMFGGATSWPYWNRNNYNKNIIVTFDAVTETATTLSQTLDVKLKNSCACSDDNGNIYICGGYGTTENARQIRKFVASSPLTNDHLLLQEDFGTDGLWTALKSKDTDFKVKVINAYLGDSNNIAQLTNAYLYDSKDLKWKSLSGESYVADMQNALNILGVN